MSDWRMPRWDDPHMEAAHQHLNAYPVDTGGASGIRWVAECLLCGWHSRPYFREKEYALSLRGLQHALLKHKELFPGVRFT